MPMPSRKLAIAVPILAVVLLAGNVPGRWGELPSRQWLEDELHGTIVAYARTPAGGFVAIVDDRRNRAGFDQLTLDPISIDWPPLPRWQLMGLGYGAELRRDPASVAAAPCPGVLGERCSTAPWLFGTIEDPAIVAFEVDRGGTTIRFPVAAPGFAVQIQRGPIPTAYRWLDAAGRVVWQTDRVAQDRWPGTRKEERRRERAEAG